MARRDARLGRVLYHPSAAPSASGEYDRGESWTQDSGLAPRYLPDFIPSHARLGMIPRSLSRADRQTIAQYFPE